MAAWGSRVLIEFTEPDCGTQRAAILYVLDMAPVTRITAWQPPIPGLREVLHAYFPDHAYPMHTHDCWTLLVVDEGAVRYDLDRHEHGAVASHVTVLPPNVPHDGRSARPGGFRKRVLYLDPALLGGPGPGGAAIGDRGGDDGYLDDDLPPVDLTGAAVDHPDLTDPLLRERIHQLHQVLAWRTEDLEAQTRLSFIRERLEEHLRRGRSGGAGESLSRSGPPTGQARPSGWGADRDPGVAARLRQLLDARVQPGISLDEAARLLERR